VVVVVDVVVDVVVVVDGGGNVVMRSPVDADISVSDPVLAAGV